MTPAQLEHLHLIDAHLERLLAIAEKMTQRKWKKDACSVTSRCESFHPEAKRHIDGGYYRIVVDGEPNDCLFIASCAGNAEAGWRATRAAIKSLLHLQSGTLVTAWHHENVEHALNSILAAFPLELIQKP